MTDSDDQPHQEALPGPLPPLSMAAAFVTRPGLFVSPPVTFGRILAFIEGYTMAVDSVRAESVAHRNVHLPDGLIGDFAARLRAEGRLRWDRWDLTVLAEAIDWTDEAAPPTDELSEEQEVAAINALLPFLEEMFALPAQLAGQRP